MTPIRYSLHYEDYSEHLMSRFGKLLQMQALVDMTLMCSSHTLRVHKAVLAASSAYFQDVLQKQTGEPLIILKMRFGVMKCLVEFMYCGKTQCPEENLDELVSAAQFLKIKGLSKVTKEGLGITSTSELPVFTPPVVINRPPQSLIDLHSQDNADNKTLNQIPTNATQTGENRTTTNDTVVRIPFDIENKGINSGEFDLRSVRPRRGRPSFRGGGWEGSGILGRAAERALLRREQDSRKAIHHLKSLQSRQMQDYMDRTLSQAVNSICEPESNSNSYMNIDSDLMYMDQGVSSTLLDPTMSFSKEHSLGSETITSSYATSSTNESNKNSNNEISSAMSQYVNALKSAGLPTDLPILFESGDGSYINVNEQVLLDMVQSSEIQYEVIEQPNIIEKVADPSEIKSIDDLSKSIERGEMLIGSNNYTSSNNFDKNNIAHEDAINTLNALLPDSLESFNEQQNYVVLDSGLQNSTNENANDFSCIENDMQYFTKSMSEDVKKYYQDQQLNDHRVVDQLCPVSSSLDTSFSMSLLDTKGSQLSESMSQQYNPLSSVRNDDCYDFNLQLTQSTHYKEDEIDCLISTPKQSNDSDRFNDNHNESRVQEQDEIMKDLMDLENNIHDTQNNSCEIITEQKNTNDNVKFGNINPVFNEESIETNAAIDSIRDKSDFSVPIPVDLEWDKDNTELYKVNNENIQAFPPKSEGNNAINFSETLKSATEEWVEKNKNEASEEQDDLCSTLDENIPFAVGLLPLKAQRQIEDLDTCKKRINEDDLCSVDAKCLKRKVKHKIM